LIDQRIKVLTRSIKALSQVAPTVGTAFGNVVDQIRVKILKVHF